MLLTKYSNIRGEYRKQYDVYLKHSHKYIKTDIVILLTKKKLKFSTNLRDDFKCVNFIRSAASPKTLTKMDGRYV